MLIRILVESPPKPTNRFIETIRKNVKYPNNDGNCGAWDCLNREQRKFLVECANYMESMEYVLQEKILNK